VLPSPCFILSDAHVGAAPPEVERAVLAFLQSLRGRAASLVINGDLFDFWFEWRGVIPRAGFRILAAVADLRDAGTEVVWMAGNHDCWGGEVLREDVGVDYRFDAWTGSLAGWRARVEHGDGLREVEDRKYRRLRTVLRHPLSIRAFRMLHPDLASRLALGSSHASRTHRAPDDGEGLRRVARETMRGDPSLELVVFGHSHVPTLERAPEGAVYANAGSWLDAYTYLEVTPGRVALCRWDGSAEGDRLHVLDRLAQEPLPDA
jgi:UDP-2,3-diacylglucosamine hydrolase